MRVEAYNQVAQLYNKNKAVKVQGTDSVGAARDEVQISAFGRDYQIAKQAVAETPDIREEQIAPLRDSVRNGSYEVETSDFADRLLHKFNALA